MLDPHRPVKLSVTSALINSARAITPVAAGSLRAFSCCYAFITPAGASFKSTLTTSAFFSGSKFATVSPAIHQCRESRHAPHIARADFSDQFQRLR